MGHRHSPIQHRTKRESNFHCIALDRHTSISPCLSHIHKNCFYSIHMLMIFFNLRRNHAQLLFLTRSKGQATRKELVAAGACRCPESIQALSSPFFSLFFFPVEGKTPESSRGEGDNSVQVGVVDEGHVFVSGIICGALCYPKLNTSTS